MATRSITCHLIGQTSCRRLLRVVVYESTSTTAFHTIGHAPARIGRIYDIADDVANSRSHRLTLPPSPTNHSVDVRGKRRTRSKLSPITKYMNLAYRRNTAIIGHAVIFSLIAVVAY